MPNKRQRARASSSGGTPKPEPQAAGPAIRPRAMLNALRLAGLMAATAVALLAYELLVRPLGWWALAAGLVAGIIARAAFLWLERAWLHAALRRAQRAEQSKAK